MKSGRFIGVMSGTSLDGVDVVLAAINENLVAQQASLTYPIPIAIKEDILAICQGQQLTLSQLGRLDTRLGRLFADAVLALMAQEKLKAADIIAIGCHGQTVWHEPAGDAPHTLQIGDNNQIAAHTGVTVVGDFRRRDMALGGQGAPLVPAFHHALLAHPVERRMVLNIGGIANLSLLAPGLPVRGYDTASLGPYERDASGDIVRLGGTRRAIFNAELSMPVPGVGAAYEKSLRFGPFFDAGQVYADSISGTNDGGAVRMSAGIAAIWVSPFGPLKFSIAQPLNSEKDDELQRFQFQMGQAF